MITILETPIQFFFEGDHTTQKIKGSYNNQAGTSMMFNDPEGEYKKQEADGLRKQVAILESQIKDKDKIIELLSNKPPM